VGTHIYPSQQPDNRFWGSIWA